jgi:alpha-beta hydrolase superfamily lysophospholipase
MNGDALILPEASRGAGARLHITHWPVDGPRAVVILAHGLFEHAGRYTHVAARMNAAGLAMVAVDHWGHGRSDGTPNFVPAFDVYLDGMDALLAHVRVEYPHLPLLLLGHSMGGLIVANHLIDRPGNYTAAAVSGAAILPATPPSRATIWISRILSRIAPRLGVVPLDATGVCRDPAVVAAYNADPLVYKGKVGARVAQQLFDAMARARAGLGHIHLPLLVQHGDADSLAAPAGGAYLHDHAGSADKKLLIYPGLYHEIYNEPEQVAVLDDLIAWYDAHLPLKA